MSVLLEKRLPTVREIRTELARRSMLEFTRYTFPTFRENWHHYLYAQKLDRFMTGGIRNLMVFAPPQHTKSEFSSRRLPAKRLGDNPNARIGIVAYNHPVASKFNRDIQRIIETPEYQELYPDTTLSRQSIRSKRSETTWLRNADEFEIVDHEGSLVTVGIGGGLTSRKLDLAIIDDPYKDAAEAWSETVRAGIRDWYDTVLRPRLHNNSQQLIVFTRWHEEDLAGYLLRTEPDEWDVLIFEALKTDRRTPWKHPDDPREVGEALWPGQLTRERLERIQENNEMVFECLYQQNPTPKEGLLLPAADLKRFSRAQIANTPPDGIVSVADIADEGDDSLSHPVGFLYGDNVYIVDIVFTQDPIEITQPRVAAMLVDYDVDRSQFESNAGGKGYALKVRELVEDYKGRTNIRWKVTTRNKHTRIVMKSGDIKERFYFLVDDEQHEEYRRYFYELTHYPKNGKVKHDDAADSTTMMAEFVWEIAARPQVRATSVGRRAKANTGRRRRAS